MNCCGLRAVRKLQYNAHRYLFSHPVLLPVQYSTSYRFKDTGGSRDTLTGKKTRGGDTLTGKKTHLPVSFYR